MLQTAHSRPISTRTAALWAVLLTAPELSSAQESPFLTGATALQTNILAWMTPVAIILIMVLGGMAMANRLSWAWCLCAIVGISQVSATYGAGEGQSIVEN